MTNELKNCPFIYCDGEAEIVQEGDYHEVRCRGCEISVTAHTRAEAIAAWNTRQPRFSTEEREALGRILYHAEADLEIRWGKLNLTYGKDMEFIETVRAMLREGDL